MNQQTNQPSTDTPLDRIDVSVPDLYAQDAWQPLFKKLREEDPVHYLQDSANGPFWSVTRHRDIKTVDTDHETYSSQLKGTSIDDPPPEPEDRFQHFLRMDPPTHDEHRRTVAPSVAPGNLKNFESLIRERVVDILEHLPIGETFNWVDHVSIELTSRMLATLMDFPYEDRRRLIYWSDLGTARPGLTGRERDQVHEREMAEAAGILTELWHERAAKPPAADLISMLAHGKETKDMIKNPALFMGTIMLLVVGGNDTTRNSISGGVIAFNQFPDQLEKLQANPGLIPNMVAEIIRWQTPVIHMRRTATRDTKLGGKRIRKGDKVIMWYVSGNRDESVFEDADRLIIDRPNARNHVAFGYGIHRCMGNRLAELQLRILWEEILPRFKHIELVGDVSRLPNNFIRGIAEVPVIVHPH